MGQKSRAKRIAGQQKSLSKGPARAHRRQQGFSRLQQWFLIGVVAITVIAVGFLAKSAFTSSSTASPSSSPPSNMSSMNDSSGGQGIAVGKRVAMTGMALPASSGRDVTLNTYRGKKLVVYFYEGVT